MIRVFALPFENKVNPLQGSPPSGAVKIRKIPGRILPALLVLSLAWLSVSVALAFTPYTTNQLVFLNVDHAPVGALSTFAYGYQGNICGFGTSSSSIPATSGGGVIIALSSTNGIQALPFVSSPSSIATSASFFATNGVKRILSPCTDQWNIPSAGLSFTHYTPAWTMSNIDTATLTDKERFFLPATWMTFTITNNTSQSEDFYFGLPTAATEESFDNGAYEGFTLGEATMAVQSGSCDLLTGASLTAALNGVSSGFAFHLSIPAGQTNSLTVVLAYYRSTIVDTRINASYYYTTLFSSVGNVIDAAFALYPDAQIRCQQLSTSMQNAGLNPYRQFLACEALHSFQCNTACLIDSNNTLYWREVEGAYGNINTCDLMVDHAFYSVVMHPWALRNVLDTFSGASDNGAGSDNGIGYSFNHPLYNETSGAEASASGFSFQHEMGGNTSGGLVSSAPSTDPTEYETVFSYMGQEELDNWILCAGLYWTHTGDNTWLTNNAALLTSCLDSMLLRDDTNSATRDGVTTYVNYSPDSGKYEITSYDSLDPSLQDPRGGAYTAGKNWAAYLAMQAMFTQLGDSTDASTASNEALLCAHSVSNGYNATLGYIPASLVGTNTSATLPVLEGLSLAQWMGFTNATSMTGPYSGMLRALQKHASNVLVSGLCLDSTTGALKITSANANTFPSKVFIAQYAAENILGLTGNTVDGTVDQVNATLQMQQSPYQGVSDQINAPGGSTLANSSLHYPRLITSSLWWLTPTNNPSFPTATSAPTSPTALTAISGNGLVALNWNASAQTIGYTIERSTSSGGPYSVIANGITGASYSDTNTTSGVTYYYVVAATNQFGSSANSSQVSVTPPVVGNSSFGAQSVAEGSYLTGDPTDWSSSLLSGTVDAVVSPGPNGSGEPWTVIPVPGLNGNNFCQIYAYQAGGGGTVYQDTGIKYQDGYTYTLTAAFGFQNNQSFGTGSSFGFYNSILSPVASTAITTNLLTLGAFTNVSVTYTGSGNEGGNGNIFIGFKMPAASVSSTYLDFSDVVLSVSNPVIPSITTQPVSKSTNAGSTVSFTVVATGTSPLSYQWYANTNTLITGATNAALTLSNVQSSASYDVVVSNPAGSITSSIVNLTVQQPITPVSLPVANNLFNAQIVSSGGYINMLTSGPPGWSASGVTNAIVAVINPSAVDGRGFTNLPVPGLNSPNYCELFAYQAGGAGVVYQDTGIKYVAGVTYNLTTAFGEENDPFPTNATMAFYNSNLTPISSQIIPVNNLTLGIFTSLTLNYTATGNEGGNGDIIIGFNLPSTAGAASFDFGNVSLTQDSASAPAITVQPLSQVLYAGQSTSFSVTAYGSTPLGYQWQAGPAGGPYTNLVNGAQISGVKSNVLSISNATTNLALAYQVIITNSYGSITSTPTATLSILPGTLLPIVNAGFDSNAIAGSNAPSYQIVTPTGWTVSGTNSSSYIGLINPTYNGTYSFTNGYSVPNALVSFSGDGIANPTVNQVLPTTLQANTTYTVSVQVGTRTTGTWGGFNILLETTNGTVVGDWVGATNNIAPSGSFATSKRSFATGPNPPGLGQQLNIVLSQAAPMTNSYSDFDNVVVVATPSTGHTNATPIDVYICAGQSNEHGLYANVANLSQTNAHYANSPDARALFAYQAAFVGASNYNTGTMGQLCPDGAGHSGNYTGFGPELSDGSDLAARFGKPLAIIKFASSGADLDYCFQKSANYLYPLMIAKITNSLQQLSSLGYTPTLKGFFWLQGESDALDNPTTYTNEIANFVRDIRTDLQVPNLEFVLTQINSNMPAFANYQTGVAEVNGAMTTLASSDPNVKFVTTDDITNNFPDGEIHYNADQTVTIGQRWAAAYTPQIAPSITTQPLSKSTNAGSNVSFTVVASGTSPLSYQWYANTNTLITGATNSTLTVNNVQSSTSYDVVVSSPYGSITSSMARLTLLPNAPLSLLATAATKSVSLSYAAVSGAKFYTIYRSKISGGPYSKIATTSATKYTDINVVSGTTYYYVVADTDGLSLSGYSTQSSAAPR